VAHVHERERTKAAIYTGGQVSRLSEGREHSERTDVRALGVLAADEVAGNLRVDVGVRS
jgi:hypothetical protein